MARNWKEVRAEAIRQGKTTEERIAQAKKTQNEAIVLYRLAEIRKLRGLAQRELAERLQVSQPSISQLETGSIDTTSLALLQRYVASLGGTLHVTASFDDRNEELSIL